jgi:hypothetical protein
LPSATTKINTFSIVLGVMYLIVAALELFALVVAALVRSSDHHHGLAVAIILDFISCRRVCN